MSGDAAGMSACATTYALALSAVIFLWLAACSASTGNLTQLFAAARADLTQRAANAGPENFLADFLQRWNLP